MPPVCLVYKLNLSCKQANLPNTYLRYGSITWPEVWPSVEAANLCNGIVPINKIWHSTNGTTGLRTLDSLSLRLVHEMASSSGVRRFLPAIVTWQMLVAPVCSKSDSFLQLLLWLALYFRPFNDPFVCRPCLLAMAISHSWHVPNLFVQVCLLSSSAPAAKPVAKDICRVPRAIALIAW